ncbi:sigma-70 family RNA polymerase sigma factor [Streptomyces jumonjinensis]|uniref:sigma-70 family RNA polymerase sigma factor n=1 Tax=Streptomyces jumonjinensis TaxID=1945 RepID=UPI0037AA4055
MSELATTEQVNSELEKYRRELTGYCYRMLGSSFEAEDAVQDTLVRAWRNAEKFEGRSSLRSWLYRIATNVCLDMLSAGSRRARPMDLSGPTPVAQARLSARPEATWLEPVPDGRVLPSAPDAADPADRAVERESIRLAFMAALQHLPPKQRAVLILREVLAWKAAEVAELLDTSVASVNSALQRARATLADSPPVASDPADPLDDEQRALLERYVAAFEGYDMEALKKVLHDDATLSMPPYDLWLQGHENIVGWMLGVGSVCRGSRLVPTVANGMPAFAHYHAAEDGDGHTPWALMIMEIRDGRIAGIHSFLDTARWFPLFDLPDRLAGESG